MTARPVWLGIAIALGLSGVASGQTGAQRSKAELVVADVQRFEAQLVLPEGAAPLASYSRNYSVWLVADQDDLPFTTMIDPIDGWPEPRETPVAFGVFVLPGVWGDFPVGIHIVPTADLPFAVHGGCKAVNLIFEPTSGKTLGAWCNVDEAPPPPTNETDPYRRTDLARPAR